VEGVDSNVGGEIGCGTGGEGGDVIEGIFEEGGGAEGGCIEGGGVRGVTEGGRIDGGENGFFPFFLSSLFRSYSSDIIIKYFGSK